jgi:hypothetical protein
MSIGFNEHALQRILALPLPTPVPEEGSVFPQQCNIPTTIIIKKLISKQEKRREDLVYSTEPGDLLYKDKSHSPWGS